MTILREAVQQSLNELQQFLNAHQNEEGDNFRDAVKEKWKDEDNACRVFLLSHLAEAIRLAADKSGNSDDNKKRKNVLIPKQEVEQPE